MIVYQQHDHDHIDNLHRHQGVLCWTFCAQLAGEKTAALRDKVQDLGETQFSNIRLKIWWGKSKFYQVLHDEQFKLQNPINFANYSPRLASSNWERWNNILELCTESRFLKKQSARIQIVQQVEISRETNQTRNGDEYCNSWWNLICVLTVCPCKAFLGTGHMSIGEGQLSLTCFDHHHHQYLC